MAIVKNSVHSNVVMACSGRADHIVVVVATWQGGLVSTQQIDAESFISLVDILPSSQFIGDPNVLVRSCCSQWNECQENDLFVAVVESESDGHDFARQAVQRGAKAVVTERLLAIETPQCIVPDTRIALGKICQALAGKPTLRMPTIGVSGTDGKTVTAHLLQSIFAAAGTQSGLLSSLVVDTGGEPDDSRRPEVNPPEIAQRLAEMVHHGCSQAIVEMSSVDLAQRTYCGLQLDAAVITNLRTDHLAFHGSKINGRRATTRILDYLKPGGFAIVNSDDPGCAALLQDLDCPVLTIGLKQRAELSAKVIERNVNEQVFLLEAGNETAVVRATIVGDHHVYNCLAAAATALAMGVSLTQIATGLSNLQSLPGRMEAVACGQPFSVWVDSSRSLNQLASALHTANRLTTGNVWCVCSTDPSQSAEHRMQLGKLLDRVTQNPVITKSRIDKATDYEPIHQVLDGFRSPKNAQIIPNRLGAIEWALGQARPGDSVLVTGAGERSIADVQSEGWSITDYDICRAWLYDRAIENPVDRKMGSADEPDIYRMDDYR